MAPDALNELLDAVPPSRRRFLKTILTGTAFAALSASLRENPAQLLYQPPARGVEIPR